MDIKLAGRIKRFPGEIMKLQDSLQEILGKISEWTVEGDYSQLKMLLPRFSYMLSMMDILESDMESAAEKLRGNMDFSTGTINSRESDLSAGQIPEADEAAIMTLDQQLAALFVVRRQVESLSESIKVSVKSIETSDRERLASDIIQRSNELKEAMRELK